MLQVRISRVHGRNKKVTQGLKYRGEWRGVR